MPASTLGRSKEEIKHNAKGTQQFTPCTLALFQSSLSHCSPWCLLYPPRCCTAAEGLTATVLAQGLPQGDWQRFRQWQYNTCNQKTEIWRVGSFAWLVLYWNKLALYSFFLWNGIFWVYFGFRCTKARLYRRRSSKTHSQNDEYYSIYSKFALFHMLYLIQSLCPLIWCKIKHFFEDMERKNEWLFWTTVYRTLQPFILTTYPFTYSGDISFLSEFTEPQQQIL